MKFEDMSIDERFEYAQTDPEGFLEAARAYQREHIKQMCRSSKNPGQCEWRLNGVLLRLNNQAEKFKDPVARLNFVFGNFWKQAEEFFSVIGGKND